MTQGKERGPLEWFETFVDIDPYKDDIALP